MYGCDVLDCAWSSCSYCVPGMVFFNVGRPLGVSFPFANPYSHPGHKTKGPPSHLHPRFCLLSQNSFCFVLSVYTDYIPSFVQTPTGMRSPPPMNMRGPSGSGASSVSPRGGHSMRGTGQNSWGGSGEVRGAPQQPGRPVGGGGGAAPPTEVGGGRQPGGGGLMSFIFGGGGQERQTRPTPQMVKLPQVEFPEG